MRLWQVNMNLEQQKSYQKKEITIPPVDKTVVIQSDTAWEDSRPWTQRLAEKIRYFFIYIQIKGGLAPSQALKLLSPVGFVV